MTCATSTNLARTLIQELETLKKSSSEILNTLLAQYSFLSIKSILEAFKLEDYRCSIEKGILIVGDKLTEETMKNFERKCTTEEAQSTWAAR